jgi:hypothetical protein
MPDAVLAHKASVNAPRHLECNRDIILLYDRRLPKPDGKIRPSGRSIPAHVQSRIPKCGRS